MVFDIPAQRMAVASEGFAVAFWAPGSDAVCLFDYTRDRPQPSVLQRLRKYEVKSGRSVEVAGAEVLAAAGLERARWLIFGRAALSPGGRFVAVSMGDSNQDEGDLIRVYAASDQCIADVAAPLHVLPTRLVAYLEWSPDETALAVAEQAETDGGAFRFETRVTGLADGAKVALAALEFEGVEVDFLGLVGFVAWSR